MPVLGSGFANLANKLEQPVDFLCNPHFFTPYRSVGDVASALSKPVVSPVSFVIIGGFLCIASGLAAAVCVSSLAATGITAISGNKAARNNAFFTAKVSGAGVLASPVLAVLSVLAAALLVVGMTVALVTRTLATLNDLAKCGDGISASAKP
ncbi:hypothetical protein [Legionella brunensis]|uniref:Transmembrane protein n=1 Tax=Legionella brunensis TaxID=29422 RepID=A0A0W0S1P5_9GAMM|nr:hypothetical protein [Legionella brunensis]KTC77092.1 hypothetical protein Lbru_3199 [Legionella brunensis]